MGKFSLSRLLACARYQRLSSEDYIRLGLCMPDTCPDCTQGHGHYVKNDNIQVKNNLLNNQVFCPGDEKPQPLKKIVNNLANDNSCNKCKENNIKGTKETVGGANLCQVKTCTTTKTTRHNKGFVNLAFIDNVTESASWYQPHLPRDLAVKIIADGPVGSFVVRNSQSQLSSGFLALTVRVPRSFNGTGVLHYLIVVTEAGFRIKGFSKVFPSLSGLVVHHTVMKENLPCRLIVETADDSDIDCDKESDFADLDADPEYPVLLSRLREQFSQ